MSTRSHIIVEVPTENSTNYVYHHCDGYLDGVGAELKDFIKNDYKPISFTGKEFCEQLEDWDSSYEYENYGPHGDEEYLYTIIIDKEDSVVSISAKAEHYSKTDSGDWKEYWEPCAGFAETIPITSTISLIRTEDLQEICSESAEHTIDVKYMYDTLELLELAKWKSGYLKSKFG